MGFKLALFLIQVLTIKHVFTYPARDYIIAYIPIEEYVYYTPATQLIELVPATSRYAPYSDNYNVRYYDGQYGSRLATPLTSSSFSVSCSSTPLPVPQPNIIETSTVLSIPAVPEVIVPSVPEIIVPNVPEVIVPSVPEVIVPNVAEVIVPSVPEVIVPNVPEVIVPSVPEAIVLNVAEVVVPSMPVELATPVLPIGQTNQAQFVTNTVVEPVLVPETAYMSPPTSPVTGKVTFRGALPAYGSIKIYASYY